VLNGNQPGKVGTSGLVLENAESTSALMRTVCNALKEHRWNEAEEMLRSIQSMVHRLRVDVRDERLPSDPPGIETHEGQDDSRRDGSS
jgi:hypothetical protein